MTLETEVSVLGGAGISAPHLSRGDPTCISLDLPKSNRGLKGCCRVLKSSVVVLDAGLGRLLMVEANAASFPAVNPSCPNLQEIAAVLLAAMLRTSSLRSSRFSPFKLRRRRCRCRRRRCHSPLASASVLARFVGHVLQVGIVPAPRPEDALHVVRGLVEIYKVRRFGSLPPLGATRLGQRVRAFQLMRLRRESDSDERSELQRRRFP